MKDKPENDFTESKKENNYYVQFYDNTTSAATLSYVLNDLRHFSTYTVSVQACRNNTDPQFHIETHCSNSAILSRRTLKIGRLLYCTLVSICI